MGGEAKSAFFRRTKDTAKSNKELHQEFSHIILYSPVTKHMKWRGTRFNGHKDTISKRMSMEISLYLNEC